MDIGTQHSDPCIGTAGNEGSWEYDACTEPWPDELSRPPRFDVHGWFRDMFSPPRKRAVHSILMDSELWTESMDAKVDELMNSAANMALTRKTPRLEREEVLEYVAVKFLKASGQELQTAMERKRELLFQRDLARWKSELLEAHNSAEDAEEFAADLVPIMTMIADLIAQKCSGLCAFYYTGPHEVHYAEGVCDLPGRAVKSFATMESSRALHLSILSQITTQSRLVNAYKWGNTKDGQPAGEAASSGDSYDDAMIVDEIGVADIGGRRDESAGLPMEKWRIATPDGPMAEIQGSAAIYAVVARQHEKNCQALCAVLEKRKEWFASLKMTPYLVAVPKRLHGGVDIDLGCGVTQAYLNFEMSNAEEGAIVMRAIDDAGQWPVYTSDLIGKRLRVVWKRRAEAGKGRMKMLDHDVDQSLPRQWAAQQPSERRGDGDMVMVGSKDTVGHLPAGADGVRVLVVTLLSWGWDIKENGRQSEVAVWESLARDYIVVLEALAKQAGNFKAPQRSYNSRAEGKRIPKVTEKAKLWAESMESEDENDVQ
ncbi:unnamed protein product [Peniophora sp. CBMAI 1063]|nr:unnamed protein product [Peniophora sp. CBMAI 1063]